MTDACQKTSDSATFSRKRPRVGEDQSDGSESGYTKDESFWYKDGNIIIVAQDVGFRLYRGLLAR